MLLLDVPKLQSETMQTIKQMRSPQPFLMQFHRMLKAKAIYLEMKGGVLCSQLSTPSDSSNYSSHIVFSRKFSGVLTEPITLRNQRRNSSVRKKAKTPKTPNNTVIESKINLNSMMKVE